MNVGQMGVQIKCALTEVGDCHHCMENFLPCPLSNQEVYAEELHMPYLDSINIVLGSGVVRLPRESMAFFSSLLSAPLDVFVRSISSIIGADRHRIEEGNAGSPFAEAFYAQGES